MPQTVVTILGEDFRFECRENEQRRLSDLARALDQRLQAFGEEGAGLRRLALVALSLMDEAQAVGAALARAHAEIERLSDAIVEARIKEDPSQPPGAGRVASLV